MPVTGFKRLSHKLGVGLSGGVLVFDESFRHFKTSVTNWHSLLGVMEYWSAEKTANPLLHDSRLHVFFAGFPLASAASRPATETQGPTAQLKKLAAGQEMNISVRTLQAPILTRRQRARPKEKRTYEREQERFLYSFIKIKR